jgi:hypothetical protein
MPVPASVAPLLAQGMLFGCQLISGQLECVPGMNNLTPQQEIKVLKQQTEASIQQADRIQGRTNALGQLILQGEAIEGQLIQAQWLNLNGGSLEPSAIHWYRSSPNGWVLISESETVNYTPQASDVGLELMAVAIVITPDGHRRVASSAIGPVQAP